MRMAPDVDLEQLGKDTHGYVGADLAQLCMEAALVAIREQLPNVDMDAEKVSLKNNKSPTFACWARAEKLNKINKINVVTWVWGGGERSAVL